MSRSPFTADSSRRELTQMTLHECRRVIIDMIREHGPEAVATMTITIDVLDEKTGLPHDMQVALDFLSTDEWTRQQSFWENGLMKRHRVALVMRGLYQRGLIDQRRNSRRELEYIKL